MGAFGEVARRYLKDLIAIAGGVLILVISSLAIVGLVTLYGIAESERFDIGLLAWAFIAGIGWMIYVVSDSKRHVKTSTAKTRGAPFGSLTIQIALILLVLCEMTILGVYVATHVPLSGTGFTLVGAIFALVVAAPLIVNELYRTRDSRGKTRTSGN